MVGCPCYGRRSTPMYMLAALADYKLEGVRGTWCGSERRFRRDKDALDTCMDLSQNKYSKERSLFQCQTDSDFYIFLMYPLPADSVPPNPFDSGP